MQLLMLQMIITFLLQQIITCSLEQNNLMQCANQMDSILRSIWDKQNIRKISLSGTQVKMAKTLTSVNWYSAWACTTKPGWVMPEKQDFSLSSLVPGLMVGWKEEAHTG